MNRPWPDTTREHDELVGPELASWFDMSALVPVLRRGKYVGQSVDEVSRVNPGYLDWMLRLDDLGAEVKAVATKALMGGYR